MGGPDEKRDAEKLDWSLIFDLIASEYSYTWEQFTGMTYKQLDACMEAINRRNHNSLVTQAALKGVKLDAYRKKKAISNADMKSAREVIRKLLAEKQKHG